MLINMEGTAPRPDDPALRDAAAILERATADELAAFRAWFFEHDWQAWDRELEEDVAAGRLDALGAEALAEYERGETTKL